MCLGILDQGNRPAQYIHIPDSCQRFSSRAHIVHSEVDNLLYSAFRFSRNGCFAVVAYRNIVRAERSQEEGANES
jgi:hypothetical protein